MAARFQARILLFIHLYDIMIIILNDKYKTPPEIVTIQALQGIPRVPTRAI